MITSEELFRAWQQGNAAALEVIVQRHHASLVAHLYRIIGEQHSAEDLAQETFLRLIQHAHAYCYPRPFLPWLYTIARNLAFNYHESAYQRHVHVGEELPEAYASDLEPGEWLDRWEEIHHLQKALQKLSFEQRGLRVGQISGRITDTARIGLPAGPQLNHRRCHHYLADVSTTGCRQLPGNLGLVKPPLTGFHGRASIVPYHRDQGATGRELCGGPPDLADPAFLADDSRLSGGLGRKRYGPGPGGSSGPTTEQTHARAGKTACSADSVLAHPGSSDTSVLVESSVFPGAGRPAHPGHRL
ncbi:RNA polymerase sigma factor [Dictyobacter kobayashii]|uniref:RNA polymerase sigma factor n=1 Tax=Dictyobacter kobayashii TaxID=2014872 RepID=UPI000F823417|nr:RNA polymerase sigma factor [Dictyobacter kobayashii]